MCSGSKSGKGSNCGENLPKVNWLQHELAFQNFSSQDRFLSTNFLFSLPSHKPCTEGNTEGMLCTRSIAFNFRNNDRLPISDVEKAWKALSSNEIACRNYLRPGVTASVKKRSALQFTSEIVSSSNGIPREENQENIFKHKDISESPYGSNTGAYTNSSVTKSTVCSTKFALDPKQAPYGSLNTGLGSHHAIHNGGNYVNGDCEDVIDDDILENIDVDQIVMDHYQANGTPVASASKHSAFTQTGPIRNATRPNEETIPTELCEKCDHGVKLGLCPEATSHLQEMKDQLISVSNDLLDNLELSSSKSESLHQERLHLRNQIRQLELYLQNQRSSQDDRYASQNLGYSSQVHIRNEGGNGGSWNTPMSVSSIDKSYTPLPPVERELFTPKIINVNYIDGSGDQKWKRVDFPWTKKLEANNRKVFGNHSFRPNQREVINASMSGYDVFVLMPTGGGKSLTYQLPALICPGVTLVVSPLVSLIQDQIMHLKQANIPAAYLSANMDWTEQQDIFRELTSCVCTNKLLYVTPEKVAKSDVLLRHLDSLYTRESLARIVIDEAHCVSQWGHDFRPDYQSLGILKQKFPTTPVLALTATATASVKEDVVQALGLENCIIFSQSFNRPNLWYSIMPKTKKCVEDIDKFIKENHYDECGIIYCLSRMDCEKVAKQLEELGHKAAFYHGSMDPPQRAYVQNQWSKDEINIICATVAFGMGINKPDVRFVIHHSLPKSIEGYHQECGRAGRDGLRSSCVLYYNYSDYIRVKHMLTQGVVEQNSLSSASRCGSYANNDRVLETNIENLLRMVSYCENDVDCRRFLQLIHFGENFNSVNCQKTCDNCLKMVTWIEKDVTDIAKQLVELVKSTGQKHSSTHILEVFRGSLSQNVKRYKHDSLNLHGAGKHLAKVEASRIMRHLVVEEFLVEDVKKSDFYGSVSAVLKVNESKACNLCSGQQSVVLRFPASTKPIKMTPAKGSLLQETTRLPQNEIYAQAQNEIDLNLSAKLYSSLRMLRTILVKEAGEGVMAYHIFGNATLQQISKRIPRTKEELLEINGIGKAKVSKYGDRVLDTIECTIREYQKANNSNSGSSGEKRRRESKDIDSNDHDDDFDQTALQSTLKSKKRVTKTASKPQSHVQCIDVDLDECDEEEEESVSKTKQRVLPKWSKSGKKGNNGSTVNLFANYMFKKV